MHKDDVMAPLVTKRLINVDEYYKMAEIGVLKPTENVELINGEIYNKVPKSSLHAAVRNHFSTLLYQALNYDHNVRIQNPVRIDQWNEPEPDLVLIKYRNDHYIDAHPIPAEVLIIIEISDTSYEFDRNIKLPLYASAGIPVYWIIDLNENCIEVYEEPQDYQYLQRTFYTSGDQIIFMDKPFDVAEILLMEC